MKITFAIPAHLQKEYLSDKEREELKKFEERALTIEEITERENEERENLKKDEKIKLENTKKDLLNRLDEIDRKTIRALRTEDFQRIQSLEADAEVLREVLKSLK